MLAWQAYLNAQTEADFAPHRQNRSADPPLQRTG